mgnify:FL=1
MQVSPYMLSVWPEGESIQVEVGGIMVLTLEGMGDSKVDPHSHIIWTNIQGSVIELNGFVGPTQVCEGGSYFIHK